MTVKRGTEKSVDAARDLHLPPAAPEHEAGAAPGGAQPYLALQRAAGNRATSAVIQREFTKPQVGVGGPALRWKPVPKAPAMGRLPSASTMAELLALDDEAVGAMCHDTAPTGSLMKMLLGAFEANWFKAKACLVFGKWPSGTPQFSEASALSLMTGLTELRGELHKLVMPLAQAQVRTELEEREEMLRPSFELNRTTKVMERPDRAPARPDLLAALGEEKRAKPADQVVYKGSVGADSVTSDVDVSTGGINSEIAVRAYNRAFRERLGLAFDPGTVLDLNVYAMDFVHGMTPHRADPKSQKVEDITSIDVLAENADVGIGAENEAARDEEQEIWSLVHVARFLPDDKDWQAYVDKTLRVISDPARREHQQVLFAKARSRAAGFEARLQSMMEHLGDEVNAAIVKLGPSSWGAEHDHFDEGAVRMRAANRLYEDKLIQVKDLRAQIKVARASGAGGPERLRKLASEVSGAVSMAQLYANEVYGSGGGTVHAVFGIQTKRKIEKARNGEKVDVAMPAAQWYQSFTDNLGDVLKDHLHLATPHGDEVPDYWYAAFKMGKYADRMIDAVPHLAKGGLISPENLAKITGSEDHEALAKLAEQHVIEKDGAAKLDPKTLEAHPYFKRMDKRAVDRLKWHAIDLGALVRGLVSMHKPAGAADALGEHGRDNPAVVLQKLLQVAEKTQEALDSPPGR